MKYLVIQKWTIENIVAEYFHKKILIMIFFEDEYFNDVFFIEKKESANIYSRRKSKTPKIAILHS